MVPSKIATAFPFCLGLVPLTKRLSAQSPRAVSWHDRVTTASSFSEITTFYPVFFRNSVVMITAAYLAEIGGVRRPAGLDRTITLLVTHKERRHAMKVRTHLKAGDTWPS
jgi:hypothetical protein